MNFFNGKSWWIWHSAGIPAQDRESAGESALFRRIFASSGRGDCLKVAVSADADYKLFFNGEEIGQGPVRGDVEEWFFDTYDLSDKLRSGENELRIIVVSFAAFFPDFVRGGPPMSSAAVTGALIVDGILERSSGEDEFIGTDEKWMAAPYPSLSWRRIAGVPCAGPGESMDMRTDGELVFQAPLCLDLGNTSEAVLNSLLPHRLCERKIPFLHKSPISFSGVFDCANIQPDAVNSMFPKKFLKIPPDVRMEFTLDFGGETTASPMLCFRKGSGSVDLYYSENLFSDGKRHWNPETEHDPVRGPMHDHIEFAGLSGEWSPFFWRAFRYMAFVIETGSEGMELCLRDCIEWKYPHPSRGRFEPEEPVKKRIWEVSRRTLELCSHDLFEDCPYYERLQYGADARIAALIAYASSGDTLLARQAIGQFRRSIRGTGLTAGSFPSRSPVILPFWSLHWIGMVYEYYRFTGDTGVLTENLAAVRHVLDWFGRYWNPSQGMGPLPFWCVADFCPQWEWHGEPPDMKKNGSALATFQYCEALEQYVEMTKAVGNPEDAVRMEAHLHSCRKAAVELFMNPTEKMFADTPGGDSFSLLTNAWSILGGILSMDNPLLHCLSDRRVKYPALFGRFFVFQALLRLGLKNESEDMLKQWEELLLPGRSVWPEGTEVPRSECHVWSAWPLVGMQRLYTGFEILEPGGGRVALSPWLSRMQILRGTIPTGRGFLEYDFSPGHSKLKIPENVEVVWKQETAMQGNGKWIKIN